MSFTAPETLTPQEAIASKTRGLMLDFNDTVLAAAEDELRAAQGLPEVAARRHIEHSRALQRIAISMLDLASTIGDELGRLPGRQ